MKLKSIASLVAAILFLFACTPKDQPKDPQKAQNQNSGQQQQPAAAPQVVNGKYNLKLNLAKGKTYFLKVLTDQRITQTVMDQKTTGKEKIGVTYSYTGESNDPNGDMLIKVVYHAFMQEIESAQGKMSYNSANPADKDNPFAKLYSSLLNKGFKMKITPSGKVLQLSGVDELLKGLVNSMDLPPQADKKQVEQMVKMQFGDNSIKEMMENLMQVYPDNPVAIGDSWSRTFTLTKGFPAILENVWTLKEVKNGRAIVSQLTKIKGMNLPEQKDGPPAPKYKISGEQSGTFEIDMASGWVQKSLLNQKISGKIEVAKSAQVKQAMTIPISMESTITTEAVK